MPSNTGLLLLSVLSQGVLAQSAFIEEIIICEFAECMGVRAQCCMLGVGVQALAHACVPDSVPASQGTWELPAEVEQIVDALCPQLCNLIEPTNEMEDLSPAGAARP